MRHLSKSSFVVLMVLSVAGWLCTGFEAHATEEPAVESSKKVKSKKVKSKKGRRKDKSEDLEAYSPEEVVLMEIIAPDPPEQFPPPYRGSVVIYTNEMAAIGLSEAAELTYNPYYAMRFAIAPRYWITKQYYARAYLNLTSEITQIDWDTDHHYISDLNFGFGADGLYTIPLIETSLSAEVSFKLPISEASRAATRLFANKLSIGLSRGFGKFSMSLGVSFEKYWHRYTTGSPTGKILGSCGASGVTDCLDMLIQNGVRNANFSFSTGVNGSFSINDWLSVAADLGVSWAFLYSLTEEELISLQVDDLKHTRYYLFSGLSATVKPNKLLSAVFGVRSFHAQLAKDGDYRIPLINRHTQLYLDIRLSIEGLVSWLKK